MITLSKKFILILIFFICSVLILLINSNRHTINNQNSYNNSSHLQETSIESLEKAISDFGFLKESRITWDIDNIDKMKSLLESYIATKTNMNKMVILFRGIPKKKINGLDVYDNKMLIINPAYPPALGGKAIPLAMLNNVENPHDDVFLHNSGDNWKGTDNSLYVSFTMDIATAYSFAVSGCGEGVILVGFFKLSELSISPNKFKEYEFLHYGIKSKCIPIPADDVKALSRYLYAMFFKSNTNTNTNK